MDKKGLAKKINVLDIVIILVVLLAVISFVFRYQVKNEIEGNDAMGEYLISFRVYDVNASTEKAFVTGDRVFVATDDTYIGNFLRLDSTNPAAKYFNDLDGRGIVAYYPEGTRVDLEGSIISSGIMNEDGYYVDGKYFLAPGKQVTFYTGHIFVDAFISDITKYEK